MGTAERVDAAIRQEHGTTLEIGIFLRPPSELASEVDADEAIPALVAVAHGVEVVFEQDRLVDLAAVVPFYLALAFPAGIPIFAAVALLRIFKLVRYSPALATLVAVVAQERTALLGAVIIMLVLLLFSSSAMFHAL